MDKVKEHLQGVMKHCRVRNRNTTRARSEEAIGVNDFQMLKIVLCLWERPFWSCGLWQRDHTSQTTARQGVRSGNKYPDYFSLFPPSHFLLVPEWPNSLRRNTIIQLIQISNCGMVKKGWGEKSLSVDLWIQDEHTAHY